MGQTILRETEILKLPYAQTTFSEMRKNGQIYVDKTDMICGLAKLDAAPVFLSRPRHFGKSLLLSTFESLFSQGLKDFENLKIIKKDLESNDRFWHNEKTYKVIHLDFSLYVSCDIDTFKYKLTQDLLSSIKDKDANDLTEAEKSISPIQVLKDYFRKKTGKSLVLLIDEYDSPITSSIDNPQKMKEMMDFISSFFFTVKFCEGMFRFVCITCVAKIGEPTLFSSPFENQIDISDRDDYSTLMGITEDELHEYFDPYVQNAATTLDMSVADVYARLKSTYGGYLFAINALQTVYNPSSLLSFLKNPEQGFANYWYSPSSGVPTALFRYLQQYENFETFNLLQSKVASSNCEEGEDTDLKVDWFDLISKHEPDKIPMNMLLYQSGCFTLKQTGKHRAKLVIPNDEIGMSLVQLSNKMRYANH
ncbi:MAG: AAA family ATPase [Succinivibrionaceae bacterium]|nr:AAA family ATPase [Succinivibrionaceae bacterium]